jgi:hypothetical protein
MEIELPEISLDMFTDFDERVLTAAGIMWLVALAMIWILNFGMVICMTCTGNEDFFFTKLWFKIVASIAAIPLSLFIASYYNNK